MYKFFLIFLFCCSFQQDIHAAEISTRERVLTQWEEALTSQNKEALPDLINNSSVDWPCLFSLESAETDAEQKLRSRSLSVANNVHAFLRRRLENVANRSPEGLLQTARYAASLVEKTTRSEGLLNSKGSDSLARVALFCLARASCTSPDTIKESRQIWQRMVAQWQIPTASTFLLRYASEDALIASQRRLIEQLEEETNYIAAVYIVGEQQPGDSEKMAASQGWKQLIEAGKTQVLLRVTFPAFLDFAAANGDWSSLSDANLDTLTQKFAADAEEYKMPLMQVRGPTPSQIKLFHSSVASDNGFLETVNRYLTSF